MALFQRIKTPFAEPEPEPEPSLADGPRSAGDFLRQRREALGLDLLQCARALNIKPAFLAALEDGRPDRLPGAAYAIGFVRAYGDYLGLDGGELLRRFKAESALDTKPDLAFPMPLGERSLPGGGMLLVALILAICGYGSWYYLSTAQRVRPQRIAEVPLSLLAPKPKPVTADSPPPAAPPPAAPSDAAAANPPNPSPATAPETPAPPAAAPASQAPAAASPQPPATAEPAPTTADAANRTAPAATPPAAAPPATPAASPVVPAVPAPTPAPTTAAATPSPAAAAAAAPDAAAGHSYGATDGSVHIVIRATADSWIQVSGSDQTTLFTRTLKTGDTYRVPDRPGLLLRTGNAGGLDVTVDGRPVPSLGKSGMVRRDIALEPQALAAGPAAQHD